MGCGASIDTRIHAQDTKSISTESSSNQKLPTYRMKKLTQLKIFLDNLSMSKELTEESQKILIKDCQSFIVSEDGEEDIVLEELIQQILALNLPALLKSGIDFIIDINTNIKLLDIRFGRYNCNGVKYLFKEITELGIDQLRNYKEKFSFLFVILGTFRYSSVIAVITL